MRMDFGVRKTKIVYVVPHDVPFQGQTGHDIWKCSFIFNGDEQFTGESRYGIVVSSGPYFMAETIAVMYLICAINLFHPPVMVIHHD